MPRTRPPSASSSTRTSQGIASGRPFLSANRHPQLGVAGGGLRGAGGGRPLSGRSQAISEVMYVCIVCMYVCMYVYVCIYVCMYVCMYICMKLSASYTYVYLYTHPHPHPHTYMHAYIYNSDKPTHTQTHTHTHAHTHRTGTTSS